MKQWTVTSDNGCTNFCRGAVRQLPQLQFQSAVRAGDARSAAAAALEALEPAVKAAMANIERASAGQGGTQRTMPCCAVCCSTNCCTKAADIILLV
jgi:hypothetical protein